MCTIALQPDGWVVAVAQLAERSLPTLEIRGSNPTVGNKVFQMYSSLNCNSEKTKIKKKRPRLDRFKKQQLQPEGLTSVGLDESWRRQQVRRTRELVDRQLDELLVLQPRRRRARRLERLRHVGGHQPLLERPQPAVARPRVPAQLDSVQSRQRLHGLLTKLLDAESGTEMFR